MLPLAPPSHRRSSPFGATALAALFALGGCGPAGSPPTSQTPPAPRATAQELNEATAAAEKAMNDGRVDDALTLARFVAERDPSGAGRELLGRVWLVRATQAEQAGDREAATIARKSAAEAYTAAAAAAPTNAPLQDATGLVVDMVGDPFLAAKYYTKAIELDPRNPAYLLHRGNAYLRTRNIDKADDDARALLALAPNEPWSNALRAESLIANLEASKALRYAARARELAPGDVTFRVLHARAMRIAETPRDAVELLMALPERERATGLVAGELALGWTALGTPERGAEAWELVYRLGSQQERLGAATAAGEARLKLGDRSAAKSWLDVATLLAPRDERVQQLARSLESAARPGG